MAKKIGSRTITVVREVKVDRLDDPSTTPPATHDIEGCAILPRSSFEEGKGWVIVEGRQVFAPYGADVLATDKVVVDGEDWFVEGEPGDYEDRKARGKVTMFYLTATRTA